MGNKNPVVCKLSPSNHGYTEVYNIFILMSVFKGDKLNTHKGKKYF